MSGETANEPEQRLVTTTQAIEMALDLIKNLELAQAAAILELVVEAEPDHAVALNYLGILKYHLSGPEASVEILLRAAAADPGHAGVQNNLGNIHVELGDIDAAIEAYRDAISLDPNLPDPYGNLAYIMRQPQRIRGGRAVAAGHASAQRPERLCASQSGVAAVEHRTQEGSALLIRGRLRLSFRTSR